MATVKSYTVTVYCPPYSKDHAAGARFVHENVSDVDVEEGHLQITDLWGHCLAFYAAGRWSHVQFEHVLAGEE